MGFDVTIAKLIRLVSKKTPVQFPERDNYFSHKFLLKRKRDKWIRTATTRVNPWPLADGRRQK